jgi:hypothetical protein
LSASVTVNMDTPVLLAYVRTMNEIAMKLHSPLAATRCHA